MNLVSIDSTWMDYPDESSLAVEVFFSGCKFNCPNCQNPELQGSNFGEEVSVKELLYKIRKSADTNKTNKVVLVGGDPLSENNIEGVKELLEVSSNEFDYCVYTGYDIDFISRNKIFGAKFYKTGVYKKELHDEHMGKTDSGITFASKNQKLYDKNLNLVSEYNVYYFDEGVEGVDENGCLPSPFGKKYPTIEMITEGSWKLQCSVNDTSVFIYGNSKEEVVENWNRRE